MGAGTSRQSAIRLDIRKRKFKKSKSVSKSSITPIPEENTGDKNGHPSRRSERNDSTSSQNTTSSPRNNRGSRDSRASRRTSFYEMVDASELNGYLIVGNQPCVENDEFLSRKKIQFVLNLSNTAVPCIKDGIVYKTILLNDEDDEDLSSHLDECLTFLHKAKKKCESMKSRILVYSYFGLSRSCSIVLAHMMKEECWTLEQAWLYLKQCHPSAKPNDGFLLQLLQYEGKLYGKMSMTIQDFYAR